MFWYTTEVKVKILNEWGGYEKKKERGSWLMLYLNDCGLGWEGKAFVDSWALEYES